MLRITLIFVLSLLYLGVKAQHYFVGLSCVFLDKKTLIKILLNPGLNSLVTYVVVVACVTDETKLWLSPSVKQR